MPSKSVEYKRADTNFYARGDVLKSDPAAVILPPTAFAQNGDTYTFAPTKKAPKTVYVEASSDWIEPITPPDMPASLNIAPDAMQIREPQGDVQVAMPNVPTSFSPVTDGMTLPNGAVVKTGTNATAAILFGGVDSARLMPDSEAAVQQTVKPQSRSAEVDLTAGGVFSKVGTQAGVTSEFQVHTPFGTALAQAGDFAAITTSGRTDVWISQGTVELLQPDGKKFGVATSDGTGPLKLIRFPALNNPAQSLQADAESLTAILNFIPVADQKLAALHAKQARGTPLTANEDAYLQRIKQVPALIKLAFVEPPPPPAPVTPPPPPVPPAPPQPITVVVHANGTIKFQNATMGLEEFQTRIKALVAAKPDQAVIIKASPKIDYAIFTAILNACKTAPFKEVAVAPPAPQPPPPAPPPPPPAPAKPAAPVAKPVAATPVAPLTPAAPVAPTNAAPATNPFVTVVPAKPAAPPTPLTVLVHEDGSIGFQGKRGSLADFKTKLAAMVQATPDRELVIKTSGPKVAYDRVKAVLDACADTHVAHVTAPPPPPAKPLPVTAETPPTPATNAAPAAPVPPVAAKPPPPAPVNNAPIPAEIDLATDGKLTLDGAPVTEDELKSKLADLKKTNPRNPLVMMKQPKVTKEQWTHYVDLCHSMGLKLLVKDAKPPVVISPAKPLPVTAETPPTPATNAAPAKPTLPVTAETPPAPVNNAPIPAEIDLAADGKLTLDGAPVSENELKSKLADLKKTNPRNPLVMMKQPKVTKEQWTHYVDLCHSMGLKLLVKDAKPPVVTPAPAPAKPLPVTAETPPTPATNAPPVASALPITAETPPAPKPPKPAPPPPVPANNAPIPAEIDLAADGKLTLDGSPVTENELKSKLADLKKTNPKNPLVMMKQPKVTKDQWTHYVDLCHSMGLKLLVKDAKPPAVTPAPVPPPATHPAAAEGGSAVQPPPTLAPHLSASPAPESATPHPSAPPAAEDSVPVEIELTPDGRISFLGEVVSETDLKSRLDGVAQANPKEPVLIVKDEKVTHDQWQKVVDICHAAKLKVKVKTVKSSDSGALKPPTHNTAVAAASAPASPPAGENPAPDLAASPAAAKIVPVEIDLATQGRLTFEGARVDVDQLEARLARYAQANSNQPVLIVKKSDVTADSLDALVTLCQSVSPHFKITVKTAKVFTPPTPPVASTASAPAENLPPPSVHMHPSMDTLGASPSAPSTSP